MKLKPLPLLITGLSFVLLFSLAANFYGYHIAVTALDKYNDSRLDPIGGQAWNLDAIAKGHHAVVLLGDSHAWNWRYPGGDVLNLGIPSQTSVQIRLRSDRYRDSLSGAMLIIFAGGNDVKSISTNLERRDAIVEQCLLSIEGIIKNHQGHFDEIVLATIPPAFKLPLMYRVLYRPEIDGCQTKINDGIRRLAGQYKVRLLDAYSILLPKIKSEKLSDDGIHMNEKAYGHLTEELTKDQSPGK
ncbi:MAG TPA: GDSL-type esterase/lipase family protein [Chitinivibrionales bacterium]|nr:GDSL-type esterase/lipase family protein [Chitinivibrionales bacterium]